MVPSYTEYDFIKGKLLNLVMTILAAWIIGGFYEEIVFRGFIQTKIQESIKSYKYSFWKAGLLTSLLFGLYHWQQGIFVMFPAFLGGLFCGVFYFGNIKAICGILSFPMLFMIR